MAPSTPPARSHPRPLDVVTLLATFELFAVQQATLPPPESVGVWVVIAGTLLRFGMDLAFFAAVLWKARSPFRVAVLVAEFGFTVAAFSYHAFFQQPWSIPASFRLASEIATLGTSFLEMAHRGVMLVGLLLLFIKLGLLAKEPGRQEGTSLRHPVAVGGACLSLALIVSGSSALAPSALRDTGFALGYALPSLAEAAYDAPDLLRARALDRAAVPVPSLTSQSTVELGNRVIVVQVESLDARLLEASHGGLAVTPFLNRLRETSLFFRLRAVHVNGSADADFTLLTATRPSTDTVNYFIEGFPYSDALPERLGARGWRTLAVHGVSGSFYRRRPAFHAMGFQRTFFAEELKALGVPEGVGWGLDDGPVLQWAAHRFVEEPGPVFMFVITFSGHAPHAWIPAGAAQVVPHPRPGAEALMNAIHYTDHQLERFVDRLPAGTTLVIYGDHGLPYRHADLAEPGREERVPVLVHRVGADLSRKQEAHRGDGEDLSNFAVWLRSSLTVAPSFEHPGGTSR